MIRFYNESPCNAQGLFFDILLFAIDYPYIEMRDKGFLGASEYSSPEHIRQNRIMASLIPTDAAPLVPGLREVGSIKVLSIAACTKYPELSMDIINYLYTPEGMLTFLYGPKGTYWDRGEDSEVLDSKLEPKERYNYSYWVSRLSEPITEAAKDWAEYTGCRSSYEYYGK